MTSEENPREKPTIIVDSDWKSQVEAEKEALRQQAGGQQPSARQDGEEMPLPPASFAVLVMTLATQALGALGMAPGPDGKPLPAQLPMAQHFIDTLAVLEEKTKGNLTEQESEMLAEALSELRLAYVSVKKGK